MIFWLIAGILTFAVVLALVWPIINGTESAGDRGDCTATGARGFCT